MSAPGKLIVIEGLDGAGKSTQVARVHDVLAVMAIPIISLREPGGSEVAERVRDLIMSETRLSPLAEAMLFQSARAQMMDEVVLPLLAAGTNVLLDRYTPSSIAYQAFANGQDLETIAALNMISTRGTYADLTILLDGDVETLMTRTGEGRNRLDKRGAEYFGKVRQGYHHCLGTSYFARRWVAVNALLDEAEVTGYILGPIFTLLTGGDHG